MSVHDIAIGQLVASSAGRDKGHVYVVIGCNNKQYLSLVDGRNRRIGQPKLKNVRHVHALQAIARDVADQISRGACVTDEEIRRTIALLYKPDSK